MYLTPEIAATRKQLRLLRRTIAVEAYQWCVYEMLSEKPALKLADADDVGHEQIIGAVVAKRGYASGGLMRIGEDELVCLEQTGQHRGDSLDAVGGARYLGYLADVPRVPDGHAAERLNPLGQQIDQVKLFLGVLVEQQV